MTYIHPSCHNCDPSTRGKPRCRLAVLRDPRGAPYARTVQVKGASAWEVQQKARDLDWEDREYDVLLVGEAPGAQEDLSGIPFVGDAGDILVDFLEKANLDVRRTYITNLVKCRPPKNRDPSKEEIKACRIHIEHELKTFNPKVIMLLGRVPLRLFNITGAVSDIHGNLYRKHLPGWEDGPEFLVVPTYHPAAFLHKHNPRLKSRVLDDYIYAKNLLQGGEEASRFYKAKFEVCDTVEKVEQAVEKISKSDCFSFDTESADLKIRQSPMIMVQLSLGEGKTWVVPFYRHDPDGVDWKLKPQWNSTDRERVTGLLRSLFENESIAKCAHNIKYDMNVIKWHLSMDVKGWLWDTSVMHHLLDAASPRKLELLGDIEFATGNWAEDVNKVVGKGKEKNKTYDHIPDDIFYQYAATDAEVTHRLLSVYYGRLCRKPLLKKLYQEQSLDSIRTFAKAEQMGSLIDKKALKAMGEEYKKEREELILKCRELYKPDFNPGSYPQVTEAFISLGLENEISKPETPSGYSTDKNTLQELVDKHPLAGLILRYRNVKKLESTYIERMAKDIEDDGRVRYSFNITGTVGGRLSCRLLHQVPRIDKERVRLGLPILRDCFIEEDDFYYFYADYSQIELRIFAVLTGEQAMLDLLSDPDADFHALTAAGALEIEMNEVSDYNRSNVGKRMNFGIIYGSQGYALAKGDYEDPKTKNIKPIGIARSKRMVASFRQRYSSVAEYLDEIPDEARANGCRLRSVFGRELEFPKLNANNEYVVAETERQAVNFTVQSPAGDITVRTANMIDSVLERYDIGLDKIRLTNCVHDSLSYGVHKDYIDWFHPVFKQIAERPIPELKNYSFPVKCGWSNSWTKAEMATDQKEAA